MSKWREVRFKDAIHFNPKVKLEKYNNYPNIGIADIDESSFYVYENEILEYKGQGGSKFETGDVLFSRITPCLENRKIARVFLENSDRGFGSTELFVFRGKKDYTLTSFVSYLAQTDIIVLPAINSMTGASGRQRAEKSFIEKLKIKIPDLKTQEKIADILSTYDRLIENNNRRIEILEKTAEEIYKEWFVRMRFPGHENTKFIKGIPEGWEIKNFINKEVKLLSSGINEFKGYKRYLATADVEGINLKHGENITFIDKPSRANMQPKENTIWFAKMQDSVKHLYFKNHSKELINNIILSTGFAGIEFKNINYYYYYLSFIRYGIFESIKDMYANGSTQVAINNQNIKRIKLLIPDENLMTKFNNIVEQNFEIIEKYKAENQNLIKQRDLLLPRLMNGTIEVK